LRRATPAQPPTAPHARLRDLSRDLVNDRPVNNRSIDLTNNLVGDGLLDRSHSVDHFVGHGLRLDARSGRAPPAQPPTAPLARLRDLTRDLVSDRVVDDNFP
jgi:hypothetical protein